MASYDDEEYYDDDYEDEDFDEYDEELDEEFSESGMGNYLGDEYDEDFSEMGRGLDEEENLDNEDENSMDEGRRKKKKKKFKDNEKENQSSDEREVSSQTNFFKTSMNKEAVKHQCYSQPEGTCPFCHSHSIYKSRRMGDGAVGLFSMLAGRKISTFYCFDKKCRFNFYKHYCFRCAGQRWIGGKIAIKQVMRID